MKDLLIGTPLREILCMRECERMIQWLKNAVVVIIIDGKLLNFQHSRVILYYY